MRVENVVVLPATLRSFEFTEASHLRLQLGLVVRAMLQLEHGVRVHLFDVVLVWNEDPASSEVQYLGRGLHVGVAHHQARSARCLLGPIVSPSDERH